MSVCGTGLTEAIVEPLLEVVVDSASLIAFHVSNNAGLTAAVIQKYRHLKEEVIYTPGKIPTFDEVWPAQSKNELITSQQKE